jgi:toxin ParE1/3/4
MRFEFHPEALEEYRQAALWYAEREPELGLQFVGSVEDTIKRVVDAPGRWRVIDEDVAAVSLTSFLTQSSTQSNPTSY